MTESVRRVCMELLGLLKSKDFSFKTLGSFEFFREMMHKSTECVQSFFFKLFPPCSVPK